MKRLLKTALCTVLILAFAFSCVSFSVSASDTVKRYGRDGLSTLPKASSYLKIYDELEALVRVKGYSVTIDPDKDPINEDEAAMIFRAFIDDWPEYFWLQHKYAYSTGSSALTFIRPIYYSFDDIEAAQAEVDEKAEELLRGLEGKSDFDKAVILHDRLASRIKYTDGGNSHNMYGGLVEGKAVCEGYSRAYQYLLHLAGIDSVIVEGASNNPSNDSPEDHAWNIVKIDGKYYHVDLTWDDQGDNVYHAYFCLTDKRIREDHTPIKCDYGFPPCNGDDALWFRKYGGLMTTAGDMNNVVSQLKSNHIAYVFVTEGKPSDLYNNWYKNHVSEILDKVYNPSGSYSYGFSYSKIGRELRLCLNMKTNYKITVVDGSASKKGVGTSEEYTGTTVHIAANKYEDQRFVRWETVSGDVKVLDPTSEETSFIMSDRKVKIRAVYAAYINGFDEPVENVFKDIETSDYYYKPILWAAGTGVTTGTSDTTFSPKDNCTRGQIVTFLWRSEGKPEPTSTVNPFKDVKQKDYYYKAVLWAVENGITNGMTENTFAPNSVCTRGQTVTFLHRSQGSPESEADISKFRDVKKSEYYASAVAWAVGNNVTNGTSDSTFEPNAKCSRGQIVTFLSRSQNVSPR